MSEANRDIPNVIAPPPTVFFAPLAFGIAGSYVLPLTFVPAEWRWFLAAPFAALGGLLGVWSLIEFVRARTSPEPWEPTRALIVRGPFRFTRNPIYLAYTLVYLSVTAGFNSLWALALLPIVLIVAQSGVIEREEKYLERKFGDAYLQYKSRVRRWL